jgi:hypothetical protein
VRALSQTETTQPEGGWTAGKVHTKFFPIWRMAVNGAIGVIKGFYEEKHPQLPAKLLVFPTCSTDSHHC